MTVPWFRFYSEVLDDPKAQKLHPLLFKRWVNILCLANRGDPRGILPDVQGIAFALRIRESDATGTVVALKKAGLLDESAGHLMPHSWGRRQPDSDDAVQRMRRTRSEHVPNKFGIEEKRTDTEQNRGETASAVALTEDGFVLPDGLLDRWKVAYPAVDISAEIHAAFEWIRANPANQKSNYQRFLVNWLKRTQDRAPRIVSQNGRAALAARVAELAGGDA